MATTTTTTVAVGMDIGSYNARVATFDESLNQPVCAHNHDGHRTTRVLHGADHNEAVTDASALNHFLENKLVPLASSAAHTKDLHIVVSVPSDHTNHDNMTAEWMQELRQRGGIISEAAAICLAYDLEETAKIHQSFLIIDAGASGIKTAKMRYMQGGFWSMEWSKTLKEVNGTNLVEPLAQFAAQQFEMKHRFPRGEVWQSKKARAKLQKACEAGLTTLQINNTLTIHVDGLYEGMDCQVTISKPKWEHLSSKLVRDAKAFLQGLLASPDEVENILLSGNMHVWMKPIVQNVFPRKLISSSLDPSEAIALGCTKQAKWNLDRQFSSSSLPVQIAPTLKIPISPISIAINKDNVVIEQGTPLPAMIKYESKDDESLEIWQMHPQVKQLASIGDLVDSSTIRLLLCETGKLCVSVGGESYDI
jgi:molecular chaperone DnaK (HSP70)